MQHDTQEQARLCRTELLLGEEVLKRTAEKRVIIFGVGGVGSWCAESLVRSGIRHLTIVDNDRVCVSNCNRQLMATTKTIGLMKVDALKERLLEINPDAKIHTVQEIYNEGNADSFRLDEYDYVIDAIDSLKDKAHLILHATSIAKAKRQGTADGTSGRLTFFSSMGAALRMDPTKVSVTEFWKVKNDPLGKALRKRFKSRGQMPSVKFKCVYSEELPMENRGTADSGNLEDGWSKSKAQVNGTTSHITAIFGFTLAGLVMEDIAGEVWPRR